ncbi:MAG: hypothetical protein IT329_20685 [Caldilineaceae bacterium]|nr:hypothetical protein [Caldilineaceae bacterium]
MYPYDIDAGVDRYNEMLRAAEEYRRAAHFSTPAESLFSRIAKLFARPDRRTPAVQTAPISGRPAASAR